VVLVRETADEWELVFPHALLPRLCFSYKNSSLLELCVTFSITTNTYLNTLHFVIY